MKKTITIDTNTVIKTVKDSLPIIGGISFGLMVAPLDGGITFSKAGALALAKFGLAVGVGYGGVKTIVTDAAADRLIAALDARLSATTAAPAAKVATKVAKAAPAAKVALATP